MFEILSAKITKEKTSRIKKKETISKEDLAYLLGDIRILKSKENGDQYLEKCHETYKELKEFFLKAGGTDVADVSDIYRHYIRSGEKLAVRREDPEKVVNLMVGEDIDLKFDPKVTGDRGDKYANCAIWPYGANPTAGISNAFLEGRGMAGPLVILTASKINPDHMEITELEGKLENIGTINRLAVKALSGRIEKSDLEFLIIRMQKDFFPEEELTKEEADNKEQRQIFRGFVFNQKERD
jgi:hypothetical protein